MAGKGNQSSSGKLSDENSAILHGDCSRPGTVCQGPLLSKNGLLAADALEVTRKPAHQINQVNSKVAHGAKTHCFLLIAPSKRQIGVSPSFAEPTRLHVQDTTSDESFLHELFHPIKGGDKAKIEASHVNQARFFAPFQHRRRLFVIHRQRLFAENREARIEGFTGHSKMHVGWRG